MQAITVKNKKRRKPKRDEIIKLTKDGRLRCSMIVPSTCRQCQNPALDKKPYCYAHDPDGRRRRSKKLKGNTNANIVGIPEELRRKLLNPRRTKEAAGMVREHSLQIMDFKFQEIVKAHDEGNDTVLVDDFVLVAELAIRANESYHRITQPPPGPAPPDSGQGELLPALGAPVAAVISETKREIKLLMKLTTKNDETVRQIPPRAIAGAVEGVPAADGQAD